MMIRRLAFSSVALLFLNGCAMHSPPEPLGDPSSPRVGWVIMQGSGDNPDEDFVCQSNPRSACELKVSTPQDKTFSEVHLYFHPIGSPAKYDGSVLVSFLGIRTASSVAIAVDAKSVGNYSVVGIVSDQPGEYVLAVSAIVTTPAGPVSVADRVSITVK